MEIRSEVNLSRQTWVIRARLQEEVIARRKGLSSREEREWAEKSSREATEVVTRLVFLTVGKVKPFQRWPLSISQFP